MATAKAPGAPKAKVPKPRAAAKPAQAAKSAKPAKPSKEELILQARQKILTALNASHDPWIAKSKLCGANAVEKSALRQLIADGTIVDLGKLGKADLATASQGHAAADVCRDLAIELIVSRSLPGALTAMPLAPGDAFWKGSMPTQVKAAFNVALKALLDSGRAVKLGGAGTKLFVLLSSLRAAAAELAGHEAILDHSAPPPPVPPRRAPPVPTATGSLDTERVRAAYRRLATRHRAVHVTIADLWRDSGAPLPALKSWLLTECRAHRADPAVGEPSLATPEQLAAALDIDGKPHLYIHLENT